MKSRDSTHNNKAGGLIESNFFIEQLLEEYLPTYVDFIIMIKSSLSQSNTFQMTQISAATTKIVTLLEMFKDFEDVSFAENANYLPCY